jgi:chondroitin sulfate proteoglycan 4
VQTVATAKQEMARKPTLTPTPHPTLPHAPTGVLFGHSGIDCVVGSWISVAGCSHSCGADGARTSTRTIQKYPQHGGKACPPMVKTASCNRKVCPTDCVLTPWSKWSKCSNTCGKGHKKRTRGVKWWAVGDTGKQCPGLDFEAAYMQLQTCFKIACPTPVDCEVSDWTPMTPCYNKHGCGAGGTLRRMKLVLKEPMGGGKMCPESFEPDKHKEGEVWKMSEYHACTMPNKCTGSPTHAPTAPPTPGACTVAEWEPTGAGCNQSCGSSGKMAFTRKIVSFGSNCPPLFESRPCTPLPPPCPVNCALTSWSPWSKCSNTCGKGHKQR